MRLWLLFGDRWGYTKIRAGRLEIRMIYAPGPGFLYRRPVAREVLLPI